MECGNTECPSWVFNEKGLCTSKGGPDKKLCGWKKPLIAQTEPVAEVPLQRGVSPTPSMNRVWAMPNHETFSVPHIKEFVKKWMSCAGGISIDLFARNKDWANYTNDLNPETEAQRHLDAEEFCNELYKENVKVNCAIFDPPYSPTQMKECYAGFGLVLPLNRAQGWGKVRSAIDRLMEPGGIVLSFGWNTIGMGRERGYRQEEIMLVSHGREHNDTICMAERKLSKQGQLWA